MRNILLSFFLLFGLSATSMAQTIDWGNSGKQKRMKSDTIAKKILEPAKYIATYAYTYVRDAADPNSKRHGETILEIGDRYNRFGDRYRLSFDSIYDEGAQRQITVMETTSQLLPLLRKEKFKENIIWDKKTNKEIIQRTAGLTQLYQYDENCPKLNWQLLEGDTIINGYKCNKAKTSLFGRDYVAWYAPEITMPYGPYKFNGLPGLVLRVTDTQNQFDFLLNGFQKVNGPRPIYLWSEKEIIKTNRKTVRQIYKNYCADPAGALASTGVIVPEETKASVFAKPYNPMELE